MRMKFDDNPNRQDAYPLKIENARFVEGAYDNGKTDGLFLELRKPLDNKLYYYGLVGRGLHFQFKKDMKVAYFDDLVGKYIIGRLNEDKSKLEDLMIEED